MTTQIAVRLLDEQLAGVDALVAAGRFESRADAVRHAVDVLLDAAQRAEIGRQIVEGYRRFPQTDEEVRWAEAAAIASIEEEPW